MVINKPKLFWGVIVSIYFYFVFYNPWPLWPSVNVFVRLPEFVFGMFFYRYWKKVDKKTFFVSILILAITTIYNPSWDGNIKTTYIGISFFLVLVYLAKWTEQIGGIRYICSWICKYSYAIFISHHIIIYELGKMFDLNTIPFSGSIMLFIVCCELILLVGIGLHQLHASIMQGIYHMIHYEKVGGLHD